MLARARPQAVSFPRALTGPEPNTKIGLALFPSSRDSLDSYCFPELFILLQYLALFRQATSNWATPYSLAWELLKACDNEELQLADEAQGLRLLNGYKVESLEHLRTGGETNQPWILLVRLGSKRYPNGHFSKIHGPQRNGTLVLGRSHGLPYTTFEARQ